MRHTSTNQKSRFTAHSIDGLVGRVLGQLGCATTINGWRVVIRWPEIVGEVMAKQSEAFRFAEGVLYVAVDDASWRQELVLRVSEILKKVHEYPFGRAVKQIRFVKGDIRMNIDGN